MYLHFAPVLGHAPFAQSPGVGWSILSQSIDGAPTVVEVVIAWVVVVWLELVDCSVVVVAGICVVVVELVVGAGENAGDATSGEGTVAVDCWPSFCELFWHIQPGARAIRTRKDRLKAIKILLLLFLGSLPQDGWSRPARRHLMSWLTFLWRFLFP